MSGRCNNGGFILRKTGKPKKSLQIEDELAKSDVDSLKEDIRNIINQKQELENLPSKSKAIEGKKKERRAARIEELEIRKKVRHKLLCRTFSAALTSTSEQNHKDRVEETIGALMSAVKMAYAHGREKEKKLLRQVEQLKDTVRCKDEVLSKLRAILLETHPEQSKDVDLSKQMTIIQEIHAEQKHLQSKIEGMQYTIDNIQKELTGRIAPRSHQPPLEQGDNAVNPPAESSNRKRSSPKSLEFAAHRYRSNDGNAVDDRKISMNKARSEVGYKNRKNFKTKHVPLKN